jgi:hypothetical protein
MTWVAEPIMRLKIDAFGVEFKLCSMLPEIHYEYTGQQIAYYRLE